jgi:predicted AlkP superfamily phosphohydrolase/phosphomutase
LSWVKLRNRLSPKILSRAVDAALEFDLKNTRAYYAFGTDGIRINLKGKESQGIVEPGQEFETLREELKERLLEIKDSETGKDIIAQAWSSERWNISRLWSKCEAKSKCTTSSYY